jgi:hypothetical protein
VDALLPRALWQPEGAAEAAVGALAVHVAVLVHLLLLPALAADRQHPAVHGDLDVLVLDAGQRGRDHDRVVGLDDVG